MGKNNKYLLKFIIVGIGIIIGSYYLLWGISELFSEFSLLISLLIFSLLISLLILLLMRIKKKNYKKIVEEAEYLYGEQNYSAALRKAESIACQNADGAALCGLMYYNGHGCDVNLQKAFSFFEMSWKRNGDAEVYYALMLLKGEGIAQNIAKGRKVLLDAVSRGNEFAMLRLGELQLCGENGIEKNIEQGMKNLKNAASAGWPYAKYLLGKLYVEEQDGISENKEKGLSLMKEAADAGISDAEKYLQKL